MFRSGDTTAQVGRMWPRRAQLGLVLIAVCWAGSWGLSGLRTHLLFAPQWLGYVLVVDAWTERRTGTSAWKRSARRFWLGFLASMPVWWLFEAMNVRLGNWEYLGREHFSDLEYAVLASVSFSTVLPAVLGTAELVRSAAFVERFRRGPKLRPSPAFDLGLALAGGAMLVAMLVWPKLAYPFAWTSLVFLLEPLCRLLGRPALMDDLALGDWRPWVSLWIGGLICGFFWELWNLHAYPKWIYHIPFLGFWKVFEMPVLGYLGYLPFALEIHLFSQLLLPRESAGGDSAGGPAAGQRAR